VKARRNTWWIADRSQGTSFFGRCLRQGWGIIPAEYGRLWRNPGRVLRSAMRTPISDTSRIAASRETYPTVDLALSKPSPKGLARKALREPSRHGRPTLAGAVGGSFRGLPNPGKLSREIGIREIVSAVSGKPSRGFARPNVGGPACVPGQGGKRALTLVREPVPRTRARTRLFMSPAGIRSLAQRHSVALLVTSLSRRVPRLSGASLSFNFFSANGRLTAFPKTDAERRSLTARPGAA
jgi:hypothetical protein